MSRNNGGRGASTLEDNEDWDDTSQVSKPVTKPVPSNSSWGGSQNGDESRQTRFGGGDKILYTKQQLTNIRDSIGSEREQKNDFGDTTRKEFGSRNNTGVFSGGNQFGANRPRTNAEPNADSGNNHVAYVNQFDGYDNRFRNCDNNDQAGGNSFGARFAPKNNNTDNAGSGSNSRFGGVRFSNNQDANNDSTAAGPSRYAIMADVERAKYCLDRMIQAEPPHFGGAVLKSRLFGGQIAAQIFAVSKQLSAHTPILTLDVSFIAPGNTLEPVFYRADTKSENVFLVDAVQSQRLIARGVVRFGQPTNVSLWQSGKEPTMEKLQPELSPRLEELMATNLSEPVRNELSQILFMSRNLMFDIHPIDISHFSGNKDGSLPQGIWYRLKFRERLRLWWKSIIHPTKIVCDRLNAQTEILSAASLRHQIRFESNEKFNPLEYFLMESENEVISHNCALVKGRIFDVKGQILLTFTQQSFISG
ncbi:thioesterase-like superfamily domain-containing protein [Ditylenchus destructor]|nr:thioesterase-like superfamily domain-containing protein [Ditylenchus destructor]